MSEKMLKVIHDKCPQNHTCPSVLICPVGALNQEGYSAPTVDLDSCTRCGKCTNFCPRQALILV